MKQCSRCGREIADTATVCDECRQQVVETVAPLFIAEETARSERPREGAAAPSASTAPSASAAPPATAVATPAGAGAPAARPGGMPRQLVLMILAVAGAGVLTLGVVMTRGSASPVAPASEGSSPAPKPAAPATAAPAAKPAVSFKGKWNSENSAYWVGRQRKSIAFELPAENKVGVWMRSVHPRLIVRCMATRTEVFVLTESAAKIEIGTEDHTVRVGLDDEPDAFQRWPDSAEHDALFAPDGAAFAQRLTTAERMRFTFTPHNASPVLIHFNVGGLGPLLDPVAKECGWKK